MSSPLQKFTKISASQKVIENNHTGNVGNVVHVDNYYYQYADFLARLATTFKDLQEFNEDQKNKYEDEALKATKENAFTREIEEFLQKTTLNLAKQEKYMDELRGKMKELLMRIDAKRLSKVKVKESEHLTMFFETFFIVFYPETEEPFRWSKFKKEVILKDNMQDFQTRLIAANLSEEDLSLLTRLKEDPWIDDFVIKRRQGEHLLELVNYIEYLDEAVKTRNEIKRLQGEIDKVKGDLPTRLESAKVQVAHVDILKDNVKHLKEINETFMKGVLAFSQEIKASMGFVSYYGLNRSYT